MQRQRGSEGFTLLEILIVVTIIGVLMTVLASSLLPQVPDKQRDLAIVQIHKVAQTLELYRVQNGAYPTTDQGLAALVRPPTIGPAPRAYARGGYAKERELEDPWGGTLVYASPGRLNTESFDLCSLGPDGQTGGDGENADICS